LKITWELQQIANPNRRCHVVTGTTKYQQSTELATSYPNMPSMGGDRHCLHPGSLFLGLRFAGR
jgi:hypothetical protein